MSISVTFAAGETKEFYAPGDFFRLLDSTAAVTLRFYDNGKEVAVAEAVEQGYAERFRDGRFDRIRIYSASIQTLKFVSRLGNDVQYDKPPQGDVNVLNVSGPFSNTQKAVGVISGQMVAANAARRYLLIQNNDTALDIWIRHDGGAAAVNANGSIKIPPGGSYELQGYAPTGAIMAIAGTANANVSVVEG